MYWFYIVIIFIYIVIIEDKTTTRFSFRVLTDTHCEASSVHQLLLYQFLHYNSIPIPWCSHCVSLLRGALLQSYMKYFPFKGVLFTFGFFSPDHLLHISVFSPTWHVENLKQDFRCSFKHSFLLATPSIRVKFVFCETNSFP